jgi:hypothetical protein
MLHKGNYRKAGEKSGNAGIPKRNGRIGIPYPSPEKRINLHELIPSLAFFRYFRKVPRPEFLTAK